MEVLEGMWLRLDESIDVDEDCFVLGITFGGRARHTGIAVDCKPAYSRLRERQDSAVADLSTVTGPSKPCRALEE